MWNVSFINLKILVFFSKTNNYLTFQNVNDSRQNLCSYE